MLTSLLVISVLFGLSGTLIESVGYLIEHRKLSYVGDKFFWNSPVKPIYASGGLLLYLSVKLLIGHPWYITILISAFLVTIWEYLGGLFCVKVLGRRLWDYSTRRINLHGHVSLWSAKWWLIFTVIFYLLLYKYVANFENYLNSTIKISKELDLALFVISLVAITILTFWRKHTFRDVRV